jgi:hypothetical protein
MSEGTGSECGYSVDGSLLMIWKCTHMVFSYTDLHDDVPKHSGMYSTKTQAKCLCTIGICPLKTYLAE